MTTKKFRSELTRLYDKCIFSQTWVLKRWTLNNRRKRPLLTQSGAPKENANELVLLFYERERFNWLKQCITGENGRKKTLPGAPSQRYWIDMQCPSPGQRKGSYGWQASEKKKQQWKNLFCVFKLHNLNFWTKTNVIDMYTHSIQFVSPPAGHVYVNIYKTDLVTCALHNLFAKGSFSCEQSSQNIWRSLANENGQRKALDYNGRMVQLRAFLLLSS